MTDDLSPDMVETLAEMMEAEAVRAGEEIAELCKQLEGQGVPAPARIYALLSAAFMHLYEQYDRDPHEAAAALKRMAKAAGESGIRSLTKPDDESWQ